ncbi:endonuclease [Adhaeribacter aerolatus]|uniref:Endonuclease n=2 Tax=Adhaeribacter aerolatus TaxID=670289 RepID=A0A512B2S8_9BACT|nr:endonuclease [Adhaeribacter aerolatus]
MSYNIRYLNKIDSINVWDNRKDKVAALMKYHQADLIGVQEAVISQIKDLEARLPDFAWYGVARMDGKEDGEFSAIYYRKSRFKLLDSGTFWYSETPNIPGSKSWDAYFPRVASWVKLKDLRSGRTLFHFNTHYDHRGSFTREKSSEILVKQVAKIAGNLPVLITGDFNTTETSKPYQILVNNTGLFDAKSISKTPHYGPAGSSSGFWVKNPVRARIDYIFVNKPVQVLQHAILTDQQDGRYFSDHLAVIAEVVINK